MTKKELMTNPDISELVLQAQTITKDERREMLRSFKETELHQILKDLFSSMQPNSLVEVTHGVKELGKDLVIVKHDNLTTDVIGVVVKCGDIKAKTIGDVDTIAERATVALTAGAERTSKEIESQIKQAFAHEAELKALVEKLKVNKVFVVVAGNISSQARTRLQHEIDRPIEIFGLDWLVENFTQYYPQVFFEGRITDFLNNKLRELETKHKILQSTKLLSDCFVEPVVRETDAFIDINEKLQAIVHNKRLPFSKLKSYASSKKNILLVGDPGTGKSAALAKLTIDLIKEVITTAVRSERVRKQTKVPILITSKELLEAETVDILLENYLGSLEIRNSLEFSILIVDGLDEVAAIRRTEVLEKARRFGEELSAAVLIASRKIDLLNLTPEGFEKLELLPFGAPQALKLIKKIHESDNIMGTLRAGLDSIRHQIPMVPLSLILLIEVVEEQGEIPASVTELYERYIDKVLGRYDKAKGIEVLFEYIIKKRFLGSLAFAEFLNKGLLEISRASFDSFVNSYGDEFSLTAEHLTRFVEELERSGILEIGEETVLFRHRSFLDYFTAFHIFEKREEFEDLNDFIVSTYFQDSWGETAFFYVGLKRDISKNLLESILNYDDDSLGIQLLKLSAGRLLQAGWYSKTKIKYAGIKQALSFASPARNQLDAVAELTKWTEPRIMADAILLSCCAHSFRSSFLESPLRQLLSELVESKDLKNLDSILCLLWTLKPMLSDAEMKNYSGNLLKAITDDSVLAPEDRIRTTLLLAVLENSDSSVSKVFSKRLRKLYSQYPKEFNQLLPPTDRKQRFLPPRRKRR